jgi:hypothetical protein
MTSGLDVAVASFGLFGGDAQVDGAVMLGLGNGLLRDGIECRGLGDGLFSGETTSTGSWLF